MHAPIEVFRCTLRTTTRTTSSFIIINKCVPYIIATINPTQKKAQLDAALKRQVAEKHREEAIKVLEAACASLVTSRAAEHNVRRGIDLTILKRYSDIAEVKVADARRAVQRLNVEVVKHGGNSVSIDLGKKLASATPPPPLSAVELTRLKAWKIQLRINNRLVADQRFATSIAATTAKEVAARRLLFANVTSTDPSPTQSAALIKVASSSSFHTPVSPACLSTLSKQPGDDSGSLDVDEMGMHIPFCVGWIYAFGLILTAFFLIQSLSTGLNMYLELLQSCIIAFVIHNVAGIVIAESMLLLSPAHVAYWAYEFPMELIVLAFPVVYLFALLISKLTWSDCVLVSCIFTYPLHLLFRKIKSVGCMDPSSAPPPSPPLHPAVKVKCQRRRGRYHNRMRRRQASADRRIDTALSREFRKLRSGNKHFSLRLREAWQPHIPTVLRVCLANIAACQEEYERARCSSFQKRVRRRAYESQAAHQVREYKLARICGLGKVDERFQGPAPILIPSALQPYWRQFPWHPDQHLAIVTMMKRLMPLPQSWSTWIKQCILRTLKLITLIFIFIPPLFLWCITHFFFKILPMGTTCRSYEAPGDIGPLDSVTRLYSSAALWYTPLSGIGYDYIGSASYLHSLSPCNSYVGLMGIVKVSWVAWALILLLPFVIRFLIRIIGPYIIAFDGPFDLLRIWSLMLYSSKAVWSAIKKVIWCIWCIWHIKSD